jgi:hypothetical protein
LRVPSFKRSRGKAETLEARQSGSIAGPIIARAEPVADRGLAFGQTVEIAHRKRSAVEINYPLRAVEGALAEANNISSATDNRFVETRIGWASFVFLKMCVAGDTLRMLCRSLPDDGNPALDRTLDHWSVAALARNMIEATVMFSYLSEIGISEDEWKLRKLVLWNHDATTRYRMFIGLKKDDQAKQFKKEINDLRSQIGQDPIFHQLDQDRRVKVNAGSEMYIRGLQSAVRNMKWDIDEFDAVYAYFSSHLHSSPVSFLRSGEHGVDFRMPTDQQFGLSALSLEWAGYCLSHANY